MNYPVLLNRNCEHIKRAKEAIEIVNHLQPYFRLTPFEVDWLPDGETKKVDPDRLLRLVERNYSGEPTIVVIQNPFDDNSFTREYRQTYMISMADWESDFAPPPLKVYLAYLFAVACINFAGDLSVEMMIELEHDPPIGCISDFYLEKQLIKLGMVGANLCGICEVKLAGMGLSDQVLRSIEEVLSYVRGATIRRPKATPSRVFIGHGRSPVWMELRKLLVEELGLKITEFNEEAAAGVGTMERLQEMLKGSCFAFLVMTAEDVHADKRSHARENVVHEIGLFQGSLGFRKAIVLKEEGVAGFSNINGLTHIGFHKQKLDDAAREEICRTLEREGIVDPSVAQRVYAPTTLRPRARKSRRAKSIARERKQPRDRLTRNSPKRMGGKIPTPSGARSGKRNRRAIPMKRK